MSPINVSDGFRRVYGSRPRHLLTMLAGFALVGYMTVTATPSLLWEPNGAWWQSMLVWFAAAVIAHDLVLFPVCAIVDRILGAVTSPARSHRETLVSVRNHLRVPLLGSALLFLIFFPGIIRQGAPLYAEDTGLTQQPFLGRWLLLTAAMLAGSSVVYAVRLLRAHRARLSEQDHQA